MTLPEPEHGPFATSATATTATSTVSSSEDPNKKIRKPYTITKSRESWTEPEHDKFLEALQLFDRDWKKIEAFVGSKTVIQIRSHAQKYFLKVQKSGTSEHLPPPRPKRKAAHPYPQKAAISVPVPSQCSEPFQSSSAVLEPGFVLRPDSSSMLMNPITSAAVTFGTNDAQPVKLTQVTKGQAVANNCCSSTESMPRTRPTEDMAGLGNHGHSLRVYRFIGSVFDPDATDQLEKLKKMDPIDVETVLLLMRNLSINLTSPDFEDHIIPEKNRREISKYLFQEGVCYAKKDFNLAKHPEIDVPNLQVIKLMQSFKSKDYVRTTFAWMHYYWYLTNDGIEFLRTYLNLPSEIVPATLKKSTKPAGGSFGGPPGDRPRGPPRFEGDRPRFGDRDGYRGGPRGGEFGGEKGDAPSDFQPSFRGSGGRPSYGRGGGFGATPSASNLP
ncbi:Myb_DNA-binding domain-containing protein/S10_plectin domain-containing protein [Cephalotus follicularis]|uniref:Myb_DNA-binding domain-containing protein/S10_plectin domain-containing protein n=1 Tax=Cephalotus follicularis TaxID=3775 RepID=A0A1Q3C7X4_CEPFO|nr:Myb_DNA-binding domain-containing protein/S10_plectin domain-containing protein [Cephalotus follicularis]